ncbi:hypothetical protein BJY04DRAFT_198307 [Aspergillus karnatakaensis]|uniref:uncharacterized protein n=1 Tax=Aspergillus karnatakaensis TaxID=1810916 RepID=UPI003CCCB0D7
MATTTPTKHPHPALSANKVPTIQSLNPSMKRSISYNISNPSSSCSSALDTETSPQDLKKDSPTGSKVDQASADNMLKASLTGFLNADDIKGAGAGDARGRKVQELLMETQRDLRKQRRESLDQKMAQRKRMSLEVIEQGMKS